MLVILGLKLFIEEAVSKLSTKLADFDWLQSWASREVSLGNVLQAADCFVERILDLGSVE